MYSTVRPNVCYTAKSIATDRCNRLEQYIYFALPQSIANCIVAILMAELRNKGNTIESTKTTEHAITSNAFVLFCFVKMKLIV